MIRVMKPSCPERLSVRSTIFASVPSERTRAITPDEFDLPDGALWSTSPHSAHAIECLRGRLWVTQAGDARDIVLGEGETFSAARRGRVVVQALGDSRVGLGGH